MTTMLKAGLFMTVISVVLIMGSCDRGVSTGKSPTDPRIEGTFTLYRLDGDRYPGDPVPEDAVLLHGWPILLTCPINAPRTRAELLTALDEGIANGGGVPVDCYNPRHALRIESKGVTTDYMICFQCRNYYVWQDDKQIGGGLISNTPKFTFNEALKNCSQLK